MHARHARPRRRSPPPPSPPAATRPSKAALPEAGTAARAVKVGKPSTRLETGLARATGPIRAREDAVLAAKGSGQIKRVRVAGGRPGPGRPGAGRDGRRHGRPSPSRTPGPRSRLAEANLAAAERELKRGQALSDQQVMAEATFDRVKTGAELAAAQLDQARAGLRMAEQQLADTVIVAPFDGVITGRFKNAGDSVTAMPLTPIVSVADVDHLEARLAVPEGVEPFVKVGPEGHRRHHPGRPAGSRPRCGSRTPWSTPPAGPSRCWWTSAKVEGAPLRPGTLVNVDFGGFGDKDGLYVPANAVQSAGAERWVFVIVGGKAEQRAIKPVQVNPGMVAVEGGLDAATAVILDPGTLAAGDAVVPLAD